MGLTLLTLTCIVALAAFAHIARRLHALDDPKARR